MLWIWNCTLTLLETYSLFFTHHRNFRGLCSYVSLARTQKQILGFVHTKDELRLVLFLVRWQTVVGLMLLVASFRKKLL